MRISMTVRATFAALLAPAFVAGAQTTQPTQTTQQPVAPKHHSVLAGAAAGAAAGSAIPGHRHPVLGAIAGAEVQHHRNKMAKKQARAAAAQQAAPTTP